jgi:hypothetical protein
MRPTGANGRGAAADLAEIDAASCSTNPGRFQRFDADGDRLPAARSPIVGQPRLAQPGWYAMAADRWSEPVP